MDEIDTYLPHPILLPVGERDGVRGIVKSKIWNPKSKISNLQSEI